MVGNIAVDCQKGLYPNLTEFKVFSTDVNEPVKLPGQRIPDGKTPEQCFTSLRNLFRDTKVDFELLGYRQKRGLGDYDEYEGYGNDESYYDQDYEWDVVDEMARDGGEPGVDFYDAWARFMGAPDAAHYFGDDGASDHSWETVEDD